jgi:hypothetical protein
VSRIELLKYDYGSRKSFQTIDKFSRLLPRERVEVEITDDARDNSISFFTVHSHTGHTWTTIFLFFTSHHSWDNRYM